MLRNYVLIAFRSLLRRKLYSFINLFGLSIAIAFCTLIYLFIEDEKSFDQFQEKKDQLYLIHSWEFNNELYEKGERWPYDKSMFTRPAVSEKLKQELPEISRLAPFFTTKGILQYNEETINQDITVTNADFFSMFSYQLISGGLKNIFQNETDLVITTAMANRLFGDDDPIGKQVTLNMLSGNPKGSLQMNVVAVLEAPPSNSSLPFEILISHENKTLFYAFSGKWTFSSPIFVELEDHSDISDAQQKINKINDIYSERVINSTRERQNVPEHLAVEELGLTSLNEIHFDKALNWEKVSDPQHAWILGGLALLIIFISCVNYVIIALTSSAARRKEVGIRKVVGAKRYQLINQFGIESILLAIISSIVGLSLASLFLPSFNVFTNKEITLSSEIALKATIAITLLSLIIGIVAGSYPSLFLSGIKPIGIFKGTAISKIGVGFAKPLVGLQFFISAVMIISCTVMYYQMAFLYKKDLGYNGNQIIKVQTNFGAGTVSSLFQSINVFRQLAANETVILGVAGISSDDGLEALGHLSLTINDAEVLAARLNMDEFTIPLLDIEIVEGKNFSTGNSNEDRREVLVNEAFVKEMGWADAINRRFTQAGVPVEYEIIGVVRDFHYASLEQSIEPLLLTAERPTTMLVKIAGNDIPGALERVQEIWKQQSPNKPFIYTFLDDEIARQYESYQRWTSITNAATIFGVAIACLGLFGLAGINAVNRTKEIGIRKVLGATLSNIFVLLNKEYVLLALIVFAFAMPITGYVMNRWWLNLFSYRIDIGWDIFGVSLLAGFTVIFITVGYHALKAALINPAEALKDE